MRIENGSIIVDQKRVILLDNEEKIEISQNSSLDLGNKCLISIEALKRILKQNVITFSGKNGFFSPKRTRFTELQLNFFSKRDYICKKLLMERFKDVNFDFSYDELICFEARKMKEIYHFLFGSEFRREPKEKDWINSMIDVSNYFLYNFVFERIAELGLIPNCGFIHRSSDLCFVYDISDIYKIKVSLETVKEVKDGPKASYGTIINAVREKIRLQNVYKDIPDLIERVFS